MENYFPLADGSSERKATKIEQTGPFRISATLYIQLGATGNTALSLIYTLSSSPLHTH
jgi:hypothetical protein